MRVHSAVELGKLGSRITAHGAEPAAKSVLDKLARSQPALSAIADMKLSDAQLGRLVTAFAKASQIKTEFRLLLAREEAFLQGAPRLTGAVADLSSFVKEISIQQPDGIRATLPISDEDMSWFLQALYEIGVLVKQREQIARETPKRIGATRKTSAKTAAENAAIGWLAAAIRRITKRPWMRQSGVLAGVLLGVDEIKEDRLRRALRNFTDRDWRQHGSSR